MHLIVYLLSISMCGAKGSRDTGPSDTKPKAHAEE